MLKIKNLILIQFMLSDKETCYRGIRQIITGKKEISIKYLQYVNYHLFLCFNTILYYVIVLFLINMPKIENIKLMMKFLELKLINPK